MPQRRVKNTKKQGFGISIHQTILILAVIGLVMTSLSFVTRWPYSLAGFFGFDAETGITNLITMLRFPALIFFIFLTIYAVKRCIEKYQESFEIPARNRR